MFGPNPIADPTRSPVCSWPSADSMSYPYDGNNPNQQPGLPFQPMQPPVMMIQQQQMGQRMPQPDQIHLTPHQIASPQQHPYSPVPHPQMMMGYPEYPQHQQPHAPVPQRVPEPQRPERRMMQVELNLLQDELKTVLGDKKEAEAEWLRAAEILRRITSENAHLVDMIARADKIEPASPTTHRPSGQEIEMCRLANGNLTESYRA